MGAKVCLYSYAYKKAYFDTHAFDGCLLTLTIKEKAEFLDKFTSVLK